MRCLALGLVLVCAPAAVLGHDAKLHAEAPAPESALFEPPAVGTYELPPIRRVQSYTLVGSDSERVALPGLAPGQVAVVSFIYRNCSDSGGCPAALALLRRLDREIARAPEIEGKTRLISVSFDPARDTPEKMRELREVMAPRTDWRFLTAANEASIDPVLVDYDQDVMRYVLEGDETPAISHLLKLYLIDDAGAVRNIYNASFMDWRIVLNDIRTLTSSD